jgi:hypothetical protein
MPIHIHNTANSTGGIFDYRVVIKQQLLVRRDCLFVIDLENSNFAVVVSNTAKTTSAISLTSRKLIDGSTNIINTGNTWSRVLEYLTN